MKEISNSIYHYLYSGVSLQLAGIIVGVFLILLHAWALLKPEATKAWLVKLPRSQSIGTWIITIDFIWAIILATSMDLGEFAKMRSYAQMALPVMYLSLMFFTNDYLGARATGILAILAACPLLNAGALHPLDSHILLSLLCYVWILFGLFWIGMPFTMRDQVAWLNKGEGRFKIACFAGIGYGVVLLVCALAFWGK